ncbi:MAG: ZIP family metal transporter [Oscillatoriales cyanobacterium SM2_2_1]|nr:ZIP family metal transporter [Oscillatoriales cyanobacterium SM2_2_1]
MEAFLAEIEGSFLAGMATVPRALPILWMSRLSRQQTALLLGAGGGMMLSATLFSLILPGIEAATAQGLTRWVAAVAMVTGMILGGSCLAWIHRRFPHEHFFKGVDGKRAANLARIGLFIAAITLYNFPEGLAVGVSCGGDRLADDWVMALGVGLQNLPEELVVALGRLLGATVVTVALPWALSFAAGSMLFVICDEIIPQSHERGSEQEGTLGIMGGFTRDHVFGDRL